MATQPHHHDYNFDNWDQGNAYSKHIQNKRPGILGLEIQHSASCWIQFGYSIQLDDRSQDHAELSTLSRDKVNEKVITRMAIFRTIYHLKRRTPSAKQMEAKFCINYTKKIYKKNNPTDLELNFNKNCKIHKRREREKKKPK